MRREIIEKIEIPADVEVEIKDEEIKMKKSGKETIRKYYGFTVKRDGNMIVLENKKSTKKEKKLIKTLAAHLANMLKGLEENYVYTLKVCSVHFPMNVSVDKAKKEVLIKNYLGEVKPRAAKILDGVSVKVDKDTIVVEGYEKEKTGQTAANIEQATRITNRDRRTFQDGIYLVEKPGEKIS